MHFYGLGFNEIHDMPIRAFWAMNAQIDRIRADEIASWLPAFTIGMGGEHVPKVFEAIQERIGKPAIVEQKRRSEVDVAKLKRHFG
ncbi:MAG: hypothetical protein LPL29_02180 [Alphaproteobacteria bacterium]|nr:hypothetical protein [Alphaproteobacteria bacterium]